MQVGVTSSLSKNDTRLHVATSLDNSESTPTYSAFKNDTYLETSVSLYRVITCPQAKNSPYSLTRGIYLSISFPNCYINNSEGATCVFHYTIGFFLQSPISYKIYQFLYRFSGLAFSILIYPHEIMKYQQSFHP